MKASKCIQELIRLHVILHGKPPSKITFTRTAILPTIREHVAHNTLAAREDMLNPKHYTYTFSGIPYEIGNKLKLHV